MVVLCVLVLTSCATCCAGSAQPTLNISTSSSTPCYGDVVTLVCHHPEVANNMGRYFSLTPTWIQNGAPITPSDGTMFEANTSPDSTSTTLTINITVDHFRDKLFHYSCLLVLAGANGLPTGEVETSRNVTIDPIGEWVFTSNGTFTCGSVHGCHWQVLQTSTLSAITLCVPFLILSTICFTASITLHESRCCNVHEVVWEGGVHASTLTAITLCVPLSV